MWKNQPYTGRKKRGGKAAWIVVLLLFLAAITAFAVQESFVFSSTGIRIDLPFLDTITIDYRLPSPEPGTETEIERVTPSPSPTPTPSPTPSPTPKPTVAFAAGSVVLPYGADDMNAYTGLSGIDALVLDVKTDEGDMPYGASLADAVSEARAAGASRVIARISCFRDSAYAGANPLEAVTEPGGAVWQDRFGYLWIWPGSRAGRDHILAAVESAVAAGVDGILLDNLHFPHTGKLSRIDYRDAPAGEARVLVIDAFYEELAELLHGRGVSLLAAIDPSAVLTGQNDKTGERLDTALSYAQTLCPSLIAAANGAVFYLEHINGALPADTVALADALRITAKPVMPILRFYPSILSESQAAAKNAVDTVRGAWPEGYILQAGGGSYPAGWFT